MIASFDPKAWQSARRLLCVRLDNLGDVLMMTPALRALREAVPQRELTLLGSPAGAAAAACIPELDGAIAWHCPWVHSDIVPEVAGDLKLLAELQARQFDGAVIFTTYSQSALPAALLCRLAGIRLSLAYSRENPYRLLSHHLPETEPEGGIRHEVQRQLDMVAAIGAVTENHRLSFDIGTSARWKVASRLCRLGVDLDQPWLLVQPGASAESRRYPAERFGQVATALYERLSLPIVYVGSSNEHELIAAAMTATRAPCYSLVGQLSLREWGAAVASARLVLANNSGAVHMAAAVGTPVVDLYALTNPQHRPWKVPCRVLSQDVDCRWCYRSSCPQGHHQCLRGVSPEQVVSAALDLWRETQSSPAETPSEALPLPTLLASLP